MQAFTRTPSLVYPRTPSCFGQYLRHSGLRCAYARTIGRAQRPRLLDITAELPEKNGRPNFFSVRTDPSAVQHPVAKAILACLRDLRGRAAVSTPSLILAEAIERLNVRVIMAARHRNRNARALANLDALIERARGYGIVGLRAFVRDLQADWERNVRAPEGRIDAAEHAIEVVTIHKAKGLEWPVVIPINSTTELYRPDQFVHRQSDNTLHWMVGGVAPPDLAAARAAECGKTPTSAREFGTSRVREREIC